MSGRLQPGEYDLRGDISSQFISGLFIALPFLEGDSLLRISGSLESRPYVEMTLDALKQFDIVIEHSNDFKVFRIRGNQQARARSLAVEGLVPGCFLCILGAVSGEIAIDGLKESSLQGDRVIQDIVRDMGAKTVWEQNTLKVSPGFCKTSRWMHPSVPILFRRLLWGCPLSRKVSYHQCPKAEAQRVGSLARSVYRA